MKISLSTWATDLFFVLLLGLGGFFLIGFYLDSSYLLTGYQDWIYHAFRAKSIAEYGLVSWDHIWSNGLNHWRGYPFGVHYLVLAVGFLFSLDVPRSMMLLTVIVFIAIRIAMYAVLRLLNIRPFYAFFGTFVSYAFAQQWNAISDFALFVVMLWVPVYVFLWAKASENIRYFFITAALSGFLWSVHPILGYSVSGMYFFLLLFRKDILHKKGIFATLAMFFISFAFFFASQFFTGYNYQNPVLSFSQFWKTTVVGDYAGLSLLYLVLLGLGWLVILIRTDHIPRWGKILHLYASFLLLFVWTGINGFIPGFIGTLQISRALTFVGFLLPFSFAALAQAAFLKSRSRFIPGVIVAIIAVAFTNGIELGSQFTGQPVSKIENPVATYFGDKTATGSIYTENVSEASYFGNPRLRYVTSYNEHRDPHPLGQRFKNLMRTDSAYTGVTQQQLQLVNAYSEVLGVEYLFLSELSPLVDSLTASDSARFEHVETLTTKSGVFSVLKSASPIHYAYVGEKGVMDKAIRFDPLTKPDLYADSFKPWDDEILRFKSMLDSGIVTPMPLQFVEKNRLLVDLSEAPELVDPAVILVQSHDDFWQDEMTTGYEMKPTALRFMYMTFPDKFLPQAVVLKNEWPTWHWVLQGLSVANLVGAAGMSLFIRSKKESVR